MRKTVIVGLAVSLLVAVTSVGAVAQDASPIVSPQPSPLAIPSESAAAPAPFAFQDPKWKKITPSRGPSAREDHTWTVDGDGRYSYLFGGRDGSDRALADLWRYDLETDGWKKLSPGGNGPSARFGHSAIWVDGFGIVVYAGQRGTDFFGDLWAYDPATDKWTELPERGEVPKRRYGTCMILGPDGRIWISHGFTFSGRFDDTRAYNLKTMRWASIAPDGRRPGERCLHDCFTSSTGQMVLYGGQDNSNDALGDLWLTRENGTWKRERDPKARARRLYAVTEAGDYAYVFGGAARDDRALDDLWRVDRETLRFKRVVVAGASPAARYAGTLITDVKGGRLLLFGGKSADVKADVWQLTNRSEVTAEASSVPMTDAIDAVQPQASAQPVE